MKGYHAQQQIPLGQLPPPVSDAHQQMSLMPTSKFRITSFLEVSVPLSSEYGTYKTVFQVGSTAVQGHLAHEKTPCPRTLQ